MKYLKYIEYDLSDLDDESCNYDAFTIAYYCSDPNILMAYCRRFPKALKYFNQVKKGDKKLSWRDREVFKMDQTLYRSRGW